MDVPSFTNEQFQILQKDLSTMSNLLKSQEEKIKVMIDKVDDLKAVFDQIKRDKTSQINKLLWE